MYFMYPIYFYFMWGYERSRLLTPSTVIGYLVAILQLAPTTADDAHQRMLSLSPHSSLNFTEDTWKTRKTFVWHLLLADSIVLYIGNQTSRWRQIRNLSHIPLNSEYLVWGDVCSRFDVRNVCVWDVRNTRQGYKGNSRRYLYRHILMLKSR